MILSKNKGSGSLLLGIDLGTTGAKAVLIDVQGSVLRTARASYPLNRPREGWSEQDPEDWWKGVSKAIRDVLQNIGPERVKGLALSGQMHGSVFLDSSGDVIRPPILWNDTRTTEQCKAMRQKIGDERLRDLVGNPVLEGFTAPKLLWLRDNEPENYKRLETLLLPKDYIVFRMTGRRSTEVSDAAGSVLFNVEKRKWEDEILTRLDLSKGLLPPVLHSTDIVGNLTESAADQLGLSSDTLVIAGGADNACSAIGNGITQNGFFLVSIGSSGVVLAHTDSMHVDQEGRLHSFNHVKPNSWYLMGVMLSAGLSFRWVKSSFGKLEESASELLNIDSYDILTKEASSVSPGSEKLIFLPYLNGERTPHADADARGVFFGLTSSHEKGHLIRSVLEGVSFGLRDSFGLIAGKGITPEQVRITGGGANSELWTQILADILGQELTKTSVNEGPAFGAALLAGVGAGIYEDVDQAIDQTIRVRTVSTPTQSHRELYDGIYEIYQSLYVSLRADYKKLARLKAGQVSESG